HASVHRQVGLLVAFDVQRGHPQPAVDRRLEDGRGDRPAVPLDLPRPPDAQRDHSHADLPRRPAFSVTLGPAPDPTSAAWRMSGEEATGRESGPGPWKS